MCKSRFAVRGSLFAVRCSLFDVCGLLCDVCLLRFRVFFVCIACCVVFVVIGLVVCGLMCVRWVLRVLSCVCVVV